MLNIEETNLTFSSYNRQSDILIKIFFSFFPVLLLLEVLRSQISEIKLLQLVPGLYLFLILVFLVFLIFFSVTIFSLPLKLDNQKIYGTKTVEKMRLTILLKFSFSLFFGVVFFLLNAFVPISLDAFNSYGSNTLENLWSLDEVLTFEFWLLFLLFFISQLPVVFTSYFSIENDIDFLLKIWKYISFTCFIVAGSLTPTVDALTQATFAMAAILLYFIVINLLQKRIPTKFLGINSRY
jgi:hypothetical protein